MPRGAVDHRRALDADVADDVEVGAATMSAIGTAVTDGGLVKSRHPERRRRRAVGVERVDLVVHRRDVEHVARRAVDRDARHVERLRVDRPVDRIGVELAELTRSDVGHVEDGLGEAPPVSVRAESYRFSTTLILRAQPNRSEDERGAPEQSRQAPCEPVCERTNLSRTRHAVLSCAVFAHQSVCSLNRSAIT